jgi:hypothetical protein
MVGQTHGVCEGAYIRVSFFELMFIAHTVQVCVRIMRGEM